VLSAPAVREGWGREPDESSTASLVSGVNIAILSRTEYDSMRSVGVVDNRSDLIDCDFGDLRPKIPLD
jgi:hypothetical protein